MSRIHEALQRATEQRAQHTPTAPIQATSVTDDASTDANRDTDLEQEAFPIELKYSIWEGESEGAGQLVTSGRCPPPLAE